MYTAALRGYRSPRHQPILHQETISPPTPSKVSSPPNTNKNDKLEYSSRGELAVQTIFFYMSLRKLGCEHVVGEVIG